ncbi:MAG: hypothetical protein HDT08_04190 [Bacteroidales bacterium]|nr:hypothetical protein [Bacteroidales bacterium]
MQQEEIKKIATAYFTSKEAEGTYSEIERAFQWLSKDYCIVPKSKVRDYYNSQQRQLNAPCSDPRDAYEQEDARSQILAITNLFGKSLFEE